MMKPFKIGGVPEHFNMPWHFLADHLDLNPDAIPFEWQDYPGGTGDLVKSLDDGSLDLATLLTEGAIKGIDAGAKFKILNFFVDTPLIWGIHVPADSPFMGMEDLKGRRYAISRYGSGSHLISYLDAQNRGWPTDELGFVEVGGLAGARKAFAKGEADIFLWEKFTTKPFVDQGEFRILGECIPPFSSFVICVSNQAWGRHNEEIKSLLDAVIMSSGTLLDHQDKIGLIANHYQMQEEDIAAWMERTRWTTHHDLDLQKLESATSILKDLELVNQHLKASNLVVDL